MVLSNLNNRKELEKLNPLFKTLFEWLETHNMAEMPLGRHDILGDTLYVNNACPKVGTKEEMPLEAHRKYIDVQVILEGKETMGWKPLEEIEHWTTEYNEVKDVIFSDEKPENYVTLKPGQVAIFWPEDGHAPGIADAPVRKFIAKVLA